MGFQIMDIMGFQILDMEISMATEISMVTEISAGTKEHRFPMLTAQEAQGIVIMYPAEEVPLTHQH